MVSPAPAVVASIAARLSFAAAQSCVKVAKNAASPRQISGLPKFPFAALWTRRRFGA
jgi:hypothetical protein